MLLENNYYKRRPQPSDYLVTQDRSGNSNETAARGQMLSLERLDSRPDSLARRPL